MAKIQDIDIPYLEFAEAAAPATPAAAITRIYVKADGLMYSKDDAGVETLMSGGDATTHVADTSAAHAASAIAFTPNGSIAATDVQAAIQEVRDEAAGGAPTTATYITASADAGLSAEVVHPELGSTWQSGSELDFSGAATGTSVTANAVTGCAGAIDYKNVGYQYWDIASAIGTGDFDVRARILSAGPGATQMAGSNSCNFYLALTDSSRTQATGLCIQAAGWGASAAVPQIIARDGIGGTQVGVTYYVGGQFPLILRVARVGTAVTRYVSVDGGLVWHIIGANTSSLNVAKVGIWGFAPNATGQRILVHKIMG